MFWQLSPQIISIYKVANYLDLNHSYYLANIRIQFSKTVAEFIHILSSKQAFCVTIPLYEKTLPLHLGRDLKFSSSPHSTTS